MKCDLLIKGRYLLTMDSNMAVIDNGFVAIQEDRIISLGKDNQASEFQAKKILDAGNSIVMPGLINAHTHAAMTYFRGLADDLTLDKWLKEYIWPSEAKYVNSDFVREYGRLACEEMIRSGITCFCDMYFFEEDLGEIVSSLGMRAVLGEGLLDFSSPGSKDAFAGLAKTEALIRKYSKDELITIAVAPHSIYACSKETLLKAKSLADKHKIRLHMHVSETEKEVIECRERFPENRSVLDKKNNGLSPVEHLDRLGILDNRTIAAHSIWLSEEDLAIYQKRGVNVAHCPISNMKLGSGIMPYEKMRSRGICISLGSDSAASNNTLDLFSDMRICALLHKAINQDPESAPADGIVKAATKDGAKALGLSDKIGSIEIGKCADLITINLDKPHLRPVYNIFSLLVYSANAGDVENVVINGKIIMQNYSLLAI